MALVSALAAGPALAQTRGTWNVDADGLWSGSSNWLNNTIAGGVSGTATFANNITATRTITLDTNRSLGSFIFGDADTSSAASWIVSGSTMTLNNGTNSALLTVNALGTGATATISAVLASSTSPSIVKNGVGTLVLSATNTFTSKLEITQGTLQVGTDRNLGAVGTFATDRITISNGATLRTSAAATLNGSRGITIGSGGGSISANGGLLQISARLSGSGNTATVTGASAVTLVNTSGTATDVNWDFSANSGLRAFFEGANALGTGSVQVRNGIRLTSQSVSSGTLTNAVTLDSGAGLTARSSGGALTYTNVTFPSAGTVTFNKDDETTSILTLTSGGGLTGNLTIDTTQGGTNAVANVVLGGVFSGTGGLVKSGTGASGRVVLRGANTYTGTTRVNTGTLQIGNGGTIGSLSPSSVITGSAGATLAFNRTDTITSGSHFNSVIGGAINVAKLGSGTVIFAGANTYTGTTNVDAGTLQLGAGGAAGSLSTSSAITGSAGATLAFNRSDTISSGTHFNNVIGGAVNVTQFGSGTVLFDGANTYSGTTSIHAGVLQLGAGGSIANSAAIVLATGSATFDIAQVSGGFSLGAAQALAGEGTVVGGMTADGTIAPGLAGAAGTLSFANNLSLGIGSILNYHLSGTNLTVGGGVNDLSSITGNLSLSGTLNVTETVAGSFLAANVGDSWRLINYTGTLTNGGFTLGSMPALSGGNTFQVDTSTANQVNLVVVPEPTTVVTVLVAIGTLGLVRSRSRRRCLGR